MPTFKEIVKSDNTNVFFNPERSEFAVECEFKFYIRHPMTNKPEEIERSKTASVRCLCIIADNDIHTRDGKQVFFAGDTRRLYFGNNAKIYQRKKLIYVNKESLNVKPKINSVILFKVDDPFLKLPEKRYVVNDVIEDGSIYRIELEITDS